MELDLTAEVDRLFDDSSLSADGHPVAVIISGGVAAGKTTLRKEKYSSGYVLIDAADIFLSLSRGEYYDFPDGLEEPMVVIGRMAAHRAVGERRNIVTEVIGDDPGSVRGLIEALRGAGYSVQGAVLTVSLDEALRRNELRDDDDISAIYAEPYQAAWIVEACREVSPRPARRIVYVDMDGVLVDFVSGLERVSPEVLAEYAGREDDIPGVFALMDPMPGALEAFGELAQRFDTYILSTAPWANPSAWSDKLEWVQKHLGEAAYKRLILTHHKDLNRGDYLIDDREAKGADRFDGQLLGFGSARFPDWAAVIAYMRAEDAVALADPATAR